MSQTVLSTHAPTLSQRFNVFFHSLLFVLGFSIVFVVGWGGAATLFGQLFAEYKSILGQVVGVVVIVLGLSTLGVLKIPWLYYDTRPQWGANKGDADSELQEVSADLDELKKQRDEQQKLLNENSTSLTKWRQSHVQLAKTLQELTLKLKSMQRDKN